MDKTAVETVIEQLLFENFSLKVEIAELKKQSKGGDDTCPTESRPSA